MTAKLLWPEREPLYELMKHRCTIGHAAFECEKQGNPINPEACEFPEEYFDYEGFWFERWPARMEIKTIALDPSKGKDAKVGDYSAIVKLGVTVSADRQQFIMYIEADLKRRPVPQIVADGCEHTKLFVPDGFALEINQFQELLEVDFQQEGLRQHVDMPIHTIDNRVNKNVRIRRIGPWLKQKRCRFKSRSPGTLLLVQQLKDFPIGDHDDGPDALEMAGRLAMELWNGKNQRPIKRLVP